MKLNAFWLKIIALIAMTVDHYGYFIEPSVDIYRIIGRLAFVIFAYFVANAYIHTSNRMKHGLILLGFGLAIDVILIATNNYVFSNIFITLSLGYFLIYSYDKKKYLISILLVALTFFLNIDYGVYGVLLISVCYIFFNNPLKIALINITLIFICGMFESMSVLQLYSTFGILLRYLYNNERGYKVKYLFYIYYPLHIIVLSYLSNYL